MTTRIAVVEIRRGKKRIKTKLTAGKIQKTGTRRTDKIDHIKMK
jgi:hypothetical protein